MLGLQACGSYCKSRLQAASRGHYACFKRFPPYKGRPARGLFPCLHLALCHGNLGFASRLIADTGAHPRDFGKFCLQQTDPAPLTFSLGLFSELCLPPLASMSAACWCVDFSRGFLKVGLPGLELGPKHVAFSFLLAARFNGVEAVEFAVRRNAEWPPNLPGVASCAGNVRFLMRAFEAGCPMWTSARDGEPCLSCVAFIPPEGDAPVPLGDWCLVVSSDLLRSGPVLLYAEEKGAALTPRMAGMLADVRSRALALAGCFHRATRLAQGPGSAARKWVAMGQVPVEIVQQIATLAKISIVARNSVK